MDPTTNTDTPGEIPADAKDANDVRESIVTPVTPSLASYVGGGASLTARAHGSSRQSAPAPAGCGQHIYPG